MKSTCFWVGVIVYIYIYRHDSGAPRSVYQSWWKQRILWKPCAERNTVRGLGILNLYIPAWNWFIPLVIMSQPNPESSPNSKGISEGPWKISGQDLSRVECFRKTFSLSPTKCWFQLQFWLKTVQRYAHGRYLAWRLPQGSILVPMELQEHACPKGVGLNTCLLYKESSRSHLPAIRD